MGDHIETITKGLRDDESNLRYVLTQDNQRGMSKSEETSWDQKLDDAVDKLRTDAAKISAKDAREVFNSMKGQEEHPLVKMDDGHLIFDNTRFQEEKAGKKAHRFWDRLHDLKP